MAESFIIFGNSDTSVANGTYSVRNNSNKCELNLCQVNDPAIFIEITDLA